MTGAIECRYYGRDFTADEMALLRALTRFILHGERMWWRTWRKLL